MPTEKPLGLSESTSRISNIRRDAERYNRLGITGNPFPGGGLSPTNPQVEPVPEIREKILNFLGRYIETASSSGLVLLGGYGAGKSYHINYIRSILKNAAYNIRIVQIADPGLHPYHVIRSILLDIGEEEIATMIWGIIYPHIKYMSETETDFWARVIVSGGSRKGSSSRSMFQIDQSFFDFTDQIWSDHRLFLKHIDRKMPVDRERLLGLVAPLLMNPDNEDTYITDIKKIAHDLLGVCLYDGVPALETWSAMTEGVGQGTIREGNERQFLTALLRLLKKSGVQYFVLLLDEFEKVPQLERMTEKDARLYLDTMRMLIDEGNLRLPFAYVLASNPDAWNIAIEKIASLEDRFIEVRLPPMTDDDIARYMVEAYLDGVRIPNSVRSNTISPFPSDFPSTVPAESRRTARQLVKLCHALIEMAAEQKIDAITEEMVQEILNTDRQ